MKNAIWGFLLLVSMVGGVSRAQADELNVGDESYKDSLSEAYNYELEERTLEPAKVYSQNNKLYIRINDQVTFAVEANPTTEALQESLGLVPYDADGNRMALEEALMDPLQSFNELSDKEKREFLERREKALASIARTLYATRNGFGVASLVKDGFVFLKRSVMGFFKEQRPQDPKEPITFKEKNIARVQSMVKMIDHMMWFEAPLVISSNEWGVVVGGGIIGEQGFRNKGAGGSEEFAISIGYNHKAKAAVVEIFHGTEVFHDSMFVTSVAGVVGKAALYARARNMDNILQVKPGKSFYPPGAPGYMSYGPDYFAAGFSTSLGWPPPPLADILTFQNDYKHPPLFTIVASPILKGFVRIKVGDLKGSAKIIGNRAKDAAIQAKNADYKGMSRAVMVRVVDVTKAMSEKLRYMGLRSSCGPVFLLPVGVK